MTDAPAELRARTVLSVSGHDDDALALQRILRDGEWDLITARNCREAFECLGGHAVPVVIAEPDLPDGCWKDLLGKIAACEPAPVLIVASRAADDRLWAEVLNLGGCDVLAKPFDPKEVLWSVNVAWREWTGHPVPAPAAAGQMS